MPTADNPSSHSHWPLFPIACLIRAANQSTRAQQAFERFVIYDVLPRDHVFHSVDQAVRKLAPDSA
jgi:hypothetical protein